MRSSAAVGRPCATGCSGPPAGWPRIPGLDMLVSNVLVIDPVLGIRKTNIGIKDGIIVGVGWGLGYSDVVDDVAGAGSFDAPHGPGPRRGPGSRLPGTVDSHVHLSSPALLDVALSVGCDHAVVGMGLGGVWDVGVNPGAQLRPHDPTPGATCRSNITSLARGSASHRRCWNARSILRGRRVQGARGLRRLSRDHRQLPLGRLGAKCHPCCARTRTPLNEAGLLADTLAAIGGPHRSRLSHRREAGAGIPGCSSSSSPSHVIGSSTTPTIPFAVNTLGRARADGDDRPTARAVGVDFELAVTRSRVRRATIEAENLLHDLGDPHHELRLHGHGPHRRAGERHAVAGQPPPGRCPPPPGSSLGRTTSACSGSWPS